MGLVVRPQAQHARLRSTRDGSNEQRRGERRLWSVPTTVRHQQRGVTHMSGRSATRALVPSGIAGVIALVLYVIIAAATAKNANALGSASSSAVCCSACLRSSSPSSSPCSSRHSSGAARSREAMLQRHDATAYAYDSPGLGALSKTIRQVLPCS